MKMRSYVNVTTFQRAKGPTCQCANVPISRCANGSTCQRASVPMCSQPPTRPTDPPITPTSLKLRRGKPITDSHGSSGFDFAPACLSCVNLNIQQWRAGSLTAPPTHRLTDHPDFAKATSGQADHRLPRFVRLRLRSRLPIVCELHHSAMAGRQPDGATDPPTY